MFVKSLRIRSIFLLFFFTLLVSCSGGNETGTSSPAAMNGVSATAMADGTISSLIPLPLNTPVDGSVNSLGNVYYTFTTDSAGTYVVNVSGIANELHILIYSDPAFTTMIESCTYWGTTALHCTTPNLDGNTAYYVRAFNISPWSSTYTISVTRGISEGSVKMPLPVVIGASHSGGVDAWGKSYYTFTTAADASFVISLAGITGIAATVDWQLYSDPTFTTPLTGLNCNVYSYNAPSVPGDISCAVPNLAAGTYYLLVNNVTTPATSYAVTVAQDTSGSYIRNPVQLSFDIPFQTFIYDNGFDYYYFVATASGSYKVNLTNTQANLGWELYSDNAYTNLILKCDNNINPGDESCITDNLDRGTYYVKVHTNSFAPGQYTIAVTGQGCSEGSLHEPVALTPRKPYPGGKVADRGKSYYTFQTESLQTGVPYLAALTKLTPSSWLEWAVFSDPAYSNLVGWCGSMTYSGDVVCVTEQYTKPVTLAPNTRYYLLVGNQSITGRSETYAVTVTPFDGSTGCSAGGTCYNFESGIPANFTSPDRPWVLDSSNPGTGAKSLRSGITRKNQDRSCFQFTATDVKWISFSFKTSFVSDSELLDFSWDASGDVFWYNAQPWQRVLIRPAAGTHNYRWCYDKTYYTSGFHNAWVDDIELNY